MLRLPPVVLGLLLATLITLPGTAAAAPPAPVHAAFATWSADGWALRSWSSTTPHAPASLGLVAPPDASLRGTAAGDTAAVTITRPLAETASLLLLDLPSATPFVLTGIASSVVALDASGSRVLVLAGPADAPAMTWYARERAGEWSRRGEIAAPGLLHLPVGFQGDVPVWASSDGHVTTVHRGGSTLGIGPGTPLDAVPSAGRERVVLTLVHGGTYRWVEVDLTDGATRDLGSSSRFGRLVPSAAGFAGGVQPGGTLPAGVPPTAAPPGQWDVPVAASPAGDLIVSERSRGAGGRDVHDQVLVVTGPGGVLVTAWGPALWLGWTASPGRALAGAAVAPLETAAPQSCWQPSGQAYQPSIAELQEIFGRAARNEPPPGYEPVGPIRAGIPWSSQAARIPTQILGAIGWVESSWRQARNTARGQAGTPLISQDCGFGVMQITSGMQAGGGYPDDQKQAIATDFRANVLRGANVLVEKWNFAPSGPFRLVGDRNPCVVEDWYYAVMAYNAMSLRNYPHNPNYNPNRPIYSGERNTGYPYQELVWGLLRNPPSEGGVPLWNSVPVTYPPLELFTDPNSVPNLPRLFPENISDTCGGGGPPATPTPAPTPTPTPLPFLASPAAIWTIAGHQTVRRFPLVIVSSEPWAATFPSPPPGWIWMEPPNGPAGVTIAQVVAVAPASIPSGQTAKTVITVYSGTRQPITVPLDILVTAEAHDRWFPFIARSHSGGW